MINCLIAIVLLLALAPDPTTSCADVPSQDTGPDRFTIGVVRGMKDRVKAPLVNGDNVIVPFAEYRDGKWLSPPKGLVDQPAPWFDRDKALAATWHYRALSGAATSIKPSKVLEVPSSCEAVWAISTSLPRKPMVDFQYDVVGLAFDTDKKIDNPIEEINSPQEKERIASFIRQAFDTSERAEISRLKSDPPESGFYVPSAEKMRKAKLVITRLSRNKEPIDGQLIYHFIAQKKYNKPPTAQDNSCETISDLDGWIMQDKGGALKLIKSQYGLTDCDGQGPSPGTSMTLLGILTIKGRRFLVIEESGYEMGAYSILEWKGSRIEELTGIGRGGC